MRTSAPAAGERAADQENRMTDYLDPTLLADKAFGEIMARLTA